MIGVQRLQLAARDPLVFGTGNMTWLTPEMIRARHLPERIPADVNSHVIACVDGKIVLVGGFVRADDVETSGACYVWNGSAMLWESLPPVPVPDETDEAAYAVVGSRLYMVGGVAFASTGFGRERTSTKPQILDIKTRSWSFGPSCEALNEVSLGCRAALGPGSSLEPVRTWAACEWRGRLYVVGCEPGYAWAAGLEIPERMPRQKTDVLCFDPAAPSGNSWSTLAPIPVALRGVPGICVHQDRVLVFGQNPPYEGHEYESAYPLRGFLFQMAEDGMSWESFRRSDGSEWNMEGHTFNSPLNYTYGTSLASLPLR